MNRVIKRIATVAAIIAVVCGLLVLLHRTGGRSALEGYKAALRAKGGKLTFAEMALRPSTNIQEIACRKALDVYWSSAAASASTWPTPELMHYVSPGQPRLAWRRKLRVDDGIATNWEWLEATNRATAAMLSPVLTALENPNPDTGWIYRDTFNNYMPGPPRTFLRDRMVARSLVWAQIGELHRGNFDESRKYLRALIAMAQINRAEPTLIHQMIRVADGQLALEATWEALQSPGWDERNLASIQDEWQQVNFLAGMELCFSAERAQTEILMSWIREGHKHNLSSILNPPTGANPPPATPATFREFWKSLPTMLYRITGSANEDELFQLTHYTEVLNLMHDVETNRPWPEVNIEMTNMMARMEKAIGQSHSYRLLVSAITIPSFARGVRATVHSETLRRMTITAIALKRYELRNGKPPPDLAALVPEILPSVPIDPMSGKPLCYRLNADGTYVLYSVGDDGKDDGGDPSPAQPGASPGLWEGRDAVWPSASPRE
jgi:hypothetical protein